MQTKNDGMNYAPEGLPSKVVKDGEFVFSALELAHGHIYGMTNGLLEAGGKLKYVYDPDPAKIEAFAKKYPGVQVADCAERILEDKETMLVASAGITNERGPLGVKVMNHGKDYFVDKAPLTTLEQLDAARKTSAKTGKKYAVYYSERLHVECAIYAGYLIEAGEIGKVVNVMGLGPHRLNAKARPKWFFLKENYGGILCDIGSHQIEQYLFFSGAKDATITRAQVGNFNHPEYPELEDFGDAMLLGDNGTSNYFRVDWFTPDGLGTWGDGRTIILGTEGYIELRKYINPGVSNSGNNILLVNGTKETAFNVSGKVGYPYFGKLILDCLNRTENAMTQEHAFKAAELCVKAELYAENIFQSK